MNKVNFKAFVIFLIFLNLSLGLAQTTRNVYVNSVRLDSETLWALESYYGHIPDNYYWYDPISGLVGLQGGPALNQIVSGLALGGPLQANASGGGTSVFVNGREIHLDEYWALAYSLGEVYPGYYWLDAQGNVGIEGGGFLFNVYAIGNSSNSGGLRADGRSIFGHSLTGSVIGDESIVGFIDGGVGVTCVPGEGCIY